MLPSSYKLTLAFLLTSCYTPRSFTHCRVHNLLRIYKLPQFESLVMNSYFLHYRA